MQPHLTPLSIDPSLLIDCPDLPQPADGRFSTLFQNHVDVTHDYADCRANHHGLIVAIKSQRGITINGNAAQPAYGDGAPASASSSRSTLNAAPAAFLGPS